MNFPLLTDSYKITHHKMYPQGTENVYSYFESRKGAQYPYTVFFGLQALLKKYFCGPVVSKEDIEFGEKFSMEHFGQNLFNKEMWEVIVNEYNGYLPLKICAVPEGTPVRVGNVLFTVEALDKRCAALVSHCETVLTHIWSSSNVTTISRHVKQFLKPYFNTTVDESNQFLIDFMLHDFGFRGVSSLESAGFCGMGHLVNFLGTDTIPAILDAQKYYSANMAGFSVPACYDDKTEVLTNRGFKFFSELNSDDFVGQYKEDGTIEFVKPIEYFKDKYCGKMICFTKNGNVDLVVTPNHKMVRKNVISEKISFFEAEEENYSHRQRIIVAGKAKEQVTDKLSPIEMLKIAFQADGAYPSRPKAYTGERTGTYPIRFSLKKQRKKERLRKILELIGDAFSESSSTKGYSHFWVPSKECFSKNFDWIDLKSISYTWAVDFINEIQYWDGCAKNNCIFYSSTNKDCVDKVQAIASLANYKTRFNSYLDKRGDRQMIYSLTIDRNRNSIKGNSVEKTSIEYDGYVYCVSVPSKMLIVRRNHVVSICGNTEHSVMTALGENGEYDMVLRTLQQFPKGIVSVVADSYSIDKFIKTCGTDPKLRSAILCREGKFVVRPDSPRHKDETPAQQILWIANELNKHFGSSINCKGYRVLHPKVGIIYGDGLSTPQIEESIDTLFINGWTASTCVYGQGGGLLQKHNRDTQRNAFKCSAQFRNGEWHDVYKKPLDMTKASKRGLLKLVKDEDGNYATVSLNDPRQNLLVEVYNKGNMVKEWTWAQVRQNAE